MSIVLTPEGTPASPVEGELYYDSTAKGAKLRFENEFKEIGTAFLQGEPHIIPGVLYPAISGKLLDGTTSHSGNYGTAQSDGRSYYYTDIKGSKPIKDPRIGGHFGSQRHKFKSLQLLEQETATHGKNVYSVDGREWIRAVDGTNSWVVENTTNGNYIGIVNEDLDGTNFLEITGYFNNANLIAFTHPSALADDIEVFINGGSEVSATSLVAQDPLKERFVDAGSVLNLNLGTINTPQITTLKLQVNDSGGGSHYFRGYGIELIAQDTTSTANRSKIQIPSQNVVSYGKKFTASGTPHYDPFNGFTSGSSVSSYIDTATSLGVENWKYSSTYYRPYNGMRVIKWVDENGTIKTSVTCMPPNARALGDQANSAKANASVANNTYLPTFEAGDVTDDQGLSEVAKTFHWREFGNGNANGGTGGAYKDASMLDGTSRDIAYVTDDGLTSLSGSGVANYNGGIVPQGVNNYIYLTFIGTGIRFKNSAYDGNFTANDKILAQNLPYGSHVIQFKRDGNAHPQIRIDGVYIVASGGDDNAIGNYGSLDEVTFYQPKKPPIPEEACILADFMLMADFVAQTANTGTEVSKGVRLQSASRDVFTTGSSVHTALAVHTNTLPFGLPYLMSGAHTMKLPFFGTRVGGNKESNGTDTTAGHVKIDGSNVSFTAIDASGITDRNDLVIQSTPSTLGVHIGEIAVASTGGSNRMDIATPIHTSHHYQSFETPFLHELVGGDRSMEQTNLVVSPDGKTWDEVTRDTSYIGTGVLNLNGIDGDTSDSDRDHETDTVALSFLDCRGTIQNKNNLYNKDFAIAYDRYICLKDGQYNIKTFTISSGSGTGGNHAMILINGNEVAVGHSGTSGYNNTHTNWQGNLNRGDYVQIYGRWHSSSIYSGFSIARI